MIAVASSPLLVSLGACDVTLSATASIGQPCRMDKDCPSGQNCVAALTPSTLICEIALDAESQDGADATVPNDGVPQLEGGFAEAGDAGDADASAADGNNADASAADGNDADASAADGNDADAQGPGDADAGGCTPTLPPSTLVLFGGQGTDKNFGDTWLWDGAAWSPVDAGDEASPPPRQAAAMATACGYAVLVGGTGPLPSDGGSLIKGDAWLWNGSGWQLAPSAPAARYAGAAATLQSTLYLFGGQGPDGIDATESGLLAWDGVAWSTPAQSSLSGPLSRVFPVVVSVGGGLLVFGGQDNSGDVLPDTWLLTDTSWQLLDDGGAESGPALQAAGATSLGGTVVMFGGQDENFDTLGDTWLWNGGAWSRVPKPAEGGPPPRAYPAMGTLNGQVVLFGGLDPNYVPLGDTWLWDGGSWVRGPDAGPPPRTGAAMTAY